MVCIQSALNMKTSLKTEFNFFNAIFSILFYFTALRFDAYVCKFLHFQLVKFIVCSAKSCIQCHDGNNEQIKAMGLYF